MRTWYNFRNGGKVPYLRRNEGGDTPVTPSAAQQPWNEYLTNVGTPYVGYTGEIYKYIPEIYGDYGYTPTPIPVTETSSDNTTTGSTYTGPVDDAGVPAPYLGVDQYDTEGDDNFLTQDEYQQQVDIISDDLGIDYDPTKTFESQLSPEAYDEFANASLGESAAQTAADTIYNNNQQIYGEPTGNNVTSLVTGNVTGLDDAGIAELQSADDDATWAGDSSPVTQLINQQVDDYQTQVETGAVPAFDMNDPSTWVDPNADSSPSIIDTATGLVSGGGEDGVGNFGVVGDVLGGIGDALGITDYAGEAEAAAQAEEAARAAEAQRLADEQVAAETARRQAEAAAEAERQRIAAEQEAARVAAEQEAARIAAEEAAAAEEVVAAPLTGGVDWGSEKVLDAQDRLAAGEIDFVTYLQEAGLQDVYTGSLGINPIGPSTVSDTGYVDAGGGPVHTTTGQHTVENEMDGATAAENYQNIKNSRNDDDPHMTHDEIIEYHKSLEKAETDLIQSDLSDDEFWDAYEDDDDGGSDDSGSEATVICTALYELGELDPEIYRLDQLYQQKHVDPVTYAGYIDWATPMAEKVKAKHWLYYPIARPMAEAWAYQMAHIVSDGKDGKKSVLGWLMVNIGEAYCKYRGGRLNAKQKSTV